MIFHFENCKRREHFSELWPISLRFWQDLGQHFGLRLSRDWVGRALGSYRPCHSAGGGLIFGANTHGNTGLQMFIFCIYSCYFDIWSHDLTATNCCKGYGAPIFNETMTWSWRLFFSFCLCLEIQREGYVAGFLPEACPQVFTTVQP